MCILYLLYILYILNIPGVYTSVDHMLNPMAPLTLLIDWPKFTTCCLQWFRAAVMRSAAIGIHVWSTLANDLNVYVGHWGRHVVNFGHLVSNVYRIGWSP